MPRKATWLVIAWNGIVLGGGALLISQARGTVNGEYSPTLTAAGQGVMFLFLFVVWLIGFLVTGLIWLMSRPKRRLCPACGRSVKSGEVVCKRCGFDFRMAQPTPVYPAGPPPGWGLPPQQVPPGWGQQAPPPWGQQQLPPQSPPGPPPGWGDQSQQ